MIVTLIVIATAGSPGAATEQFQERLVMGSIAECQDAIATKIARVLHSRPDVQGVAATCYVTVNGQDL